MSQSRNARKQAPQNGRPHVPDAIQVTGIAVVLLAAGAIAWIMLAGNRIVPEFFPASGLHQRQIR